MRNVNNISERTTKWIRLIARIWSSPIIVYSLLMVAGYAWNWVTIGKADPHAVESYPIVEALPPIFMFFSVLGLGIAWRWERLGGAITLIFQFIVLILLLIQRPITQDFCWAVIPYLIWLVILIPGVMFFVVGEGPKRD